MDNQDDISALRDFPCGSSRVQHLYDAILQALTIWFNLSLSGKINSCLSPWLAGAPLIALQKKDYCYQRSSLSLDL